MSTTCSPFNVASQKYGGNCLEESSSNGLSNACINTINGNVSAGWESASNGTIDSFIKIGFHTVFTINKLRIQPSLVSGRQIKDILMEFSDCSYEKVRSRGENCQGRNEVYGIRDQGPKKGGIRNHSPGIWDHKPRDRDQRCLSLDQGSGVLDQQNFVK